MKNGNIDLDLSSLGTQAVALLRRISAYKAFVFFIAVAMLYGFIIWRINVFSSEPPSQSEESAQTTTQPHINPATVAKIQSLQDNSVNVQTLFSQARDNPFHE